MHETRSGRASRRDCSEVHARSRLREDVRQVASRRPQGTLPRALLRNGPLGRVRCADLFASQRDPNGPHSGPYLWGGKAPLVLRLLIHEHYLHVNRIFVILAEFSIVTSFTNLITW